MIHRGVSLNKQLTVGFVACHCTHPDHVARLSQGENLGITLLLQQGLSHHVWMKPTVSCTFPYSKEMYFYDCRRQLTMPLPAQLLSSTCMLIECPLYLEPHVNNLAVGMLVFLLHEIVWLAIFTSKQLGRTLKTWSNCTQQLERVLPCILKIYRKLPNVLHRDISLSPAATSGPNGVPQYYIETFLSALQLLVVLMVFAQ